MSDGARVLRVGLTQWHATTNVADNVATAEELIAEAGESSADLVVLPENGLMLGTNAQMREAALRVDSPEITQLREAARRANTVVVLGGFKQHDDISGVHNTALVIDADGEIAGGYNKIHLFDATVGGQSFAASSVEQRGDTPALLRIGDTLVGLSICFDVRFPELYRQLAHAGAEVLLVPAAFTAKTGAAHWEVLLRARAIENGAYVVASATVQGSDGAEDAFATYGHAMAVDPWGCVLAELGEDQAAVSVLELDLSRVGQVRKAMPVLRGAQPQAYSATPEIIEPGRDRQLEAT